MMREAEKEDKAEVASGMTIGSLRRFKAASIGPTQGRQKRSRLRLQRCLRTSHTMSSAIYVSVFCASLRSRDFPFFLFWCDELSLIYLNPLVYLAVYVHR